MVCTLDERIVFIYVVLILIKFLERDLKVPDVLEELKRVLFDAHGIDAEDIFHKKGNKLNEKVIAEELQAESFPDNGDTSQYDPHDIANVILEWFSRMPTPIFATIDEDELAMCAIDEEECHVSSLIFSPNTIFHFLTLIGELVLAREVERTI